MAQAVSTSKLNRTAGIKDVRQDKKLRHTGYEYRPGVSDKNQETGGFREKATEYQDNDSGKGMSIIAFLGLLGFAVSLDFVDLLDFTGFGAVITTIVSFVLGLGMYVWLYFVDKGDYRFAREMVGWVLEIFPGIGVLPINTFAVFLSWYLSQPQAKQKVSQVMEATEAGKAVAETAGKISKTSKVVRAGK